MLQNTMHRQVLILASSQSLFQTVSVMVMTIGGLAGANIANTPTLATLPIASMFLGTALMMFPAITQEIARERNASFATS
ncbi:MFS transporter, partial [Acinetobacter baumannii]|nr:MFS transporter [Acinetobacter baumannii]